MGQIQPLYSGKILLGKKNSLIYFNSFHMNRWLGIWVLEKHGKEHKGKKKIEKRRGSDSGEIHFYLIPQWGSTQFENTRKYEYLN